MFSGSLQCSRIGPKACQSPHCIASGGGGEGREGSDVDPEGAVALQQVHGSRDVAVILLRNSYFRTYRQCCGTMKKEAAPVPAPARRN